MSKYVATIVFLSLLLLTQFLTMFYSVHKVSEAQSRFRVEESMFRNAVEFACTSYLSRVVHDLPTNDVPKESPSLPEPSFVSCDLGTWPEFGRYACSIDGVRLHEGDYCQYGLIVRIVDGAVYCKSDKFYVLRRGRAVADDLGLPRVAARPEPGAL